MNVRNEVNKTILEICAVIQGVCKKECHETSAELLPNLVQSAAALIKSAENYID